MFRFSIENMFNLLTFPWHKSAYVKIQNFVIHARQTETLKNSQSNPLFVSHSENSGLKSIKARCFSRHKSQSQNSNFFPLAYWQKFKVLQLISLLYMHGANSHSKRVTDLGSKKLRWAAWGSTTHLSLSHTQRREHTSRERERLRSDEVSSLPRRETLHMNRFIK
jgi:hypothetical protein